MLVKRSKSVDENMEPQYLVLLIKITEGEIRRLNNCPCTVCFLSGSAACVVLLVDR